MNIPSELRYTKEHEWVRVTGNTATIGITDFAQKELGDIVFIELPGIGDQVSTDGEISAPLKRSRRYRRCMLRWPVA